MLITSARLIDRSADYLYFLKEEVVSLGPPELVKCNDLRSIHACGLDQLNQSTEIDEMNGNNHDH